MVKKDLQGVVGIDEKIPFIEKFMFSSLTGTSTFYFLMVQTWLLFFYTDVLKISAAYVGIMFIVVRTLDAVSTPLIGVYIDNHKLRWGKYRPWLLILNTGISVGGFLAFISFHYGETGNTILATITYIIFSLCISAGPAAGAGFTASTTKRQDDRMLISIMGFIWTLLLSVVAQVGSQPIITVLGGGSLNKGFTQFMLIAMVIFVIWYFLYYKFAKERFTLESSEQETVKLKDAVKHLAANKYALITIIFIFALNLTTSVRSTIGIYYYKYYFNEESLLATVAAITILPTLIGSFLCPQITKRLGLKNNLIVAAVVNIVASAAMFFVPATAVGKIILVVLSCVGGLFIGIAQPAQGTMMPMAIDYNEWKLHSDNGGFYGALMGFFQTLATAISGGIVALILAIVHYMPDVAQTTNALIGIKSAMSILPAIFFLCGFIVVRWDMTEEKHEEIVQELNQRGKNVDLNVK